jgi:hypothetical protein
MVRKFRFPPALAAVVGIAFPVFAQSVEPRPGWITDAAGCVVWNPYPQPGEAISWSGACSVGLATGYGVLQWFLNGAPFERYEGTFREGRPNGWGKHRDRAGNLYEGEWRDGMMSGHGTFTWADGSRYEGQFIDNGREGQGVYSAANGASYTGTWHKNKPHGYGKGTDKDGGLFQGSWSQGCFQEGERQMALFTTNRQCGFK